MNSVFSLSLGGTSVVDILIPEDFPSANWGEAKLAAKKYGRGFRLPYDFELEALFKSSLFRGLLKNASYWSATDTAKTRARSQIYRNGGDFRAIYYQHPGDIEPKEALNYFFFIKKSNKTKSPGSLFINILELALYDSIRKKYHLNKVRQ